MQCVFLSTAPFQDTAPTLLLSICVNVHFEIPLSILNILRALSTANPALMLALGMFCHPLRLRDRS
jgi:hypothetical protein